MNIVNLTPHDIHICDADGRIVRTIHRSGNQARCAVSSVEVGQVDGIPLVTTQFGEVSGLPEPQSSMLYLVSLLVRQAVPHRLDVVSPGDMVRDGNGQIVGCKNLTINSAV
jgi:hypothetical protein